MAKAKHYVARYGRKGYVSEQENCRSYADAVDFLAYVLYLSRDERTLLTQQGYLSDLNVDDCGYHYCAILEGV